MTGTTSVKFSVREFADNPEPRCPCLLLLDTSESMGGAPIGELNDALAGLARDLKTDGLAAKRVELGLITFGPVKNVFAFNTADSFRPEPLVATGNTPMGAAIEQGLKQLEVRKAAYKANGIAYYRPWVMLMTDGAPTDAWAQAAAMVRDGEKRRAFSFFAIGVEGADMDVLRQIAAPTRPPLKLAGLKFGELFSWLSTSLKDVSRSNLGQTVPLTPPGWAEV